jgi:hypothetical protein
MSRTSDPAIPLKLLDPPPHTAFATLFAKARLRRLSVNGRVLFIGDGAARQDHAALFGIECPNAAGGRLDQVGNLERRSAKEMPSAAIKQTPAQRASDRGLAQSVATRKNALM